MRYFFPSLLFILTSFTLKSQPTQFTAGGSQQLYWNWRPDISDSSYEFVLETYNTVYFSSLNTCSRVGIYYWNECTYTKPYFNCTITGPGVATCANDLLFDTLFKVTPGTGEFDSLCGYVNPYNVGMSGIADTYTRTSPNRFKVRYKGILTLPEKCSKWHFSIGDINPFDCNGTGDVSYRTSNKKATGSVAAFEKTNIDSFVYKGYINGINTIPVNLGSIHMVTLNNLDFQNNNSPRCLNPPLYISPIGQKSTVSPAPFDPDYDSLDICIADTIFSNDLPNIFPTSNWQLFLMQNANGEYSSDLFIYKNWFAPLPGQTGTNPLRYDAKYNPFDTDSTFQLDPQTGEVSFVAQSEMHPLLFFSIKDYRNGILASETFYFNQFTVLPSNRPLSTFHLDTTTLNGGVLLPSGRIRAFHNTPLSFEYDIKLNVAAGHLVVQTTADSTLPGNASCQIINNRTDSVRCKFSWTPDNSANGLYSFYTQARDSNCVVPFAQYTQVYTHPIEVGPYFLGVRESNERLGLEIIPNPNSGQFLLRSSSTLHEIDILDLSGKPILELRNLNTKSLQLDLSTISPGTYFVLSPGMYPQKVMILK
jgi:hypothetical protein